MAINYPKKVIRPFLLSGVNPDKPLVDNVLGLLNAREETGVCMIACPGK